MIDTHCHLDRPEFDPDRGEVLARARAAGVSDVIVPAVMPCGWRPLLQAAAATPGLHAGLGIHPQFLPELDPADDDRHLADLDAALAGGGAVAVGECGLDGPTALAGAPLDRQRAVLAGHLALARKHHLPVSLHAFHALGPLLALLERDGLPDGGVLHSFSGSAEQVPPFVRLGLHFAFAGPVTWERARKPRLAVRVVPTELLLLETDAPDQTPRPHRGRCEPAYLAEVCAGVAAALERLPAEVDALTTRNARRLFRLGGEGA